MKILENNLKQFIDVPNDILELTNSFITEVEEFKPLTDLNNLVIGYVLSKEKHDNADTLSVLQVDLGNGLTSQIVCGAANVDKGQYVIIAKEGAILPGDFLIKKSKIRGVESNGMVCSLIEIGIDEKSIPLEYKEGIFFFSEPKEIGSNALTHLDLDGFVMELSLTPNRSDLLSHYGYALDLAAVLNKEINLPSFEITESDEVNPLSVEINSSKTNSYHARYLKKITITESPWWLKVFLNSMDCQPINNVVDITNYILYTYGTPMHAFDANKFGSNKIQVIDNKNKLTLETLDDSNVNLVKEEILITNGSNAMAIGGIMGLKNSMITSDTKDVILEIASFDSLTIRNTSKELNLKSDSSLRFDRGIDESVMMQALNHATYLLQKYANATVLKGVSSSVINTNDNPEITINELDISSKIGMDLSKEAILGLLKRLNYSVINLEKFIVKAPSYRHDILHDYDVLEEVVRLYGMDQVENKALKIGGLGKLSNEQKTTRRLRHYLANIGFNEVVTYSLLKEDNVKLFNDIGDIVSIIKPLTIDRKSMRQSLLNGLIDATNYNRARNITDVNLFEIGHVYATGIENNYLSLSLTSPLSNNLWKKDNPIVDFYYMSGILANIFSILNIEYNLVASNLNNFHPYQQAEIFVKGNKVGLIGLVHPKLSKKPIFAVELDLSKVSNPMKFNYESISKFPNVERDIAIVLKDDVLMDDVLKLISQTARKQLISTNVFDIYKGEHIEKGYKSVAIRLVFNDKNKTLESNDVEKLVNKILKRIEFELDGQIRS